MRERRAPFRWWVVDSEEQTSGFGAYSLTYLGLDLGGLTAPDGVTPGRFFTNYSTRRR